jgi:hypothetical protein
MAASPYDPPKSPVADIEDVVALRVRPRRVSRTELGSNRLLGNVSYRWPAVFGGTSRNVCTVEAHRIAKRCTTVVTGSSHVPCLHQAKLTVVPSGKVGGFVASNSALLTDTYTSLLRARHGAAKRER